MEVVEITSENSAEISVKIAEIHANSYSRRHFTSTFGIKKLSEYNQLLINNSDISLAAFANGQLLGFLISGESVSSGVREFIHRNRGFLIGKLLSHPNFLLSKITSRLRGFVSSRNGSNVKYRLMSIATTPAVQSKGVGAELLLELEERLRKRGIKSYGLSVLATNIRAIDFYNRKGFVYEKEDIGSVYLTKDID